MGHISKAIQDKLAAYQGNIICILGPTGSGKTELAILAARHFGAPIINVDSRQVYREMPIGSAAPTHAELALAPHYLVKTHSVEAPLTAGTFAGAAHEIMADLFAQEETIILSGGSTLYFEAILNYLDNFPPVTTDARESVNRWYEEGGIEHLVRQLKALDKPTAESIDTQNMARVRRALEVSLSGGLPYSHYKSIGNQPVFKAANLRQFYIDLPRELLYERINIRCENMLQAGLLDEVASLRPYRYTPPLQTVGYKEFFPFLDGETDRSASVETFKKNTRNYAKRQLTWIRNRTPAIPVQSGLQGLHQILSAR